jgi:hypothetical protein
MKHKMCVSCEIHLSESKKVDLLAFSQQCKMEMSFTNKTKGYAQVTFKDLTMTFRVVTKQLEHCQGVS